MYSCSFLALVLRKALHEKITGRNWKLEWNDFVRDICDQVEEFEVSSRKMFCNPNGNLRCCWKSFSSRGSSASTGITGDGKLWHNACKVFATHWFIRITQLPSVQNGFGLSTNRYPPVKRGIHFAPWGHYCCSPFGSLESVWISPVSIGI